MAVISTYAEQIERLEDRRLLALANGNAEEYARLCEEIGIASEDVERPELIERAEADRLVRKNPFILEKSIEAQITAQVKAPRRRENAANPAKYARFLEDAEEIYNPSADFSLYVDTKRELLAKHFPGRYSQQGMADYDSRKLGAVFNQIVESARKIARQG
jgi:crotonobetainyl-CoA:carnitine CoA-transferase CaiB-like acyl-CoA transferase